MTLQLGFDGVRIIEAPQGVSDTALRQCLEVTGEQYRTYASAIAPGDIDGAAEPEVYWRIVFSILSVHSPIQASLLTYQRLRLAVALRERMPGQQRIRRIIESAHADDGVVQYANQKARFVKEFDSGWRVDKTRYTRNGESDHDWRLRLARNVKGIAYAKASFAVALCRPVDADVACIDTHMHRILTGRRPRGAIGKGQYLALEERLRRVAKRAGVPTFVAQWALWDAARGVCEPHAALAGKGV